MERFLLDTNVISEVVRPTPSENVIDWMAQQPNDALYLSVITIAEIVRGVSRLVEGKKKATLMQWIDKDLTRQFKGRILDFDFKSSELWGQWQGDADHKGRPFPVMDLQIASIAHRFGLILATRNTKDFYQLPVDTFNPWD